MNYLKSSLGLVLCLLLSVSLSAQGPGKRGPRPAPGQQMEELLEKLDLNAEQEAAMKTLMEDTHTQLKSLEEQTFDNPQDRRAAVRKIMETRQEKVAEILTEDQLSQMKALHGVEGPRRGPRPQLDKAKREALHKEVKAYQEENMVAVLAAQRSKLEDKISALDKATIEEIRAEIKAQKGEKEPRLKQGRRPMHKPGQQVGQRERPAHHAKVKSLMDTYGADIETLLAEIAPKADQWHKDLEAIHEKYAPENASGRKMGQGPNGKKQGRNAKPHQAQGQRTKGQAGKANLGQARGQRTEGLQEKRHAVHFLLMDPEAPTATGILEEDRFGLAAYPNPTNSTATVAYTVKESGKVSIILRNKTGNLNQVLLDTFKEPGDYTLEVDLSNLQDGLYFYTISNSADGASLTKQLIINK